MAKEQDQTLFEMRPDIEEQYNNLRKHLKEMGLLGKLKLF